jgi:hypothetical protein
MAAEVLPKKRAAVVDGMKHADYSTMSVSHAVNKQY